MKKLLLILAVCTLGFLTAKADYFVGYDDGCQVFYRTYYGFYRYCPDYGSVFLGYDWNGLTWNNGGFWRGGQHWNSWGRNNWHGRGGNWHGNRGNWHGQGQHHGGGHHGGH